MEFDFLPDIELEKKQELATKPTFEPDEFYNYLDEYESYFTDHFGWRNVLINANAQIKYWLCNKSPLPHKAMIGKDGWLFLSPSIDMIISDKFDYLDPTIFKIMEDSLLNKTREFKKNGMTYYVMITPEKSYTYSELLPGQYNKERIEQRFNSFVSKLQLNPELNVININNIIKESKASSPDTLHFKYDSHWNTLGALYVYQYLTTELKKKYPSIIVRKESDYEKTSAMHVHNDIAEIINIAKHVSNKEYYLTFKGDDASGDVSYSTKECTESFYFTNSKNKDKPDIIFLHDSFGLPFKPWLTHDFHTTHSFWILAYNFDINQLASLGPKVVVHQMTLRNSPLFKQLLDAQ